MTKSERLMEWVAGRAIPKHLLQSESKTGFWTRKILVHVETSESEGLSGISADDSLADDSSADNTAMVPKKVRFTPDTKNNASSKDHIGDKNKNDKKSIPKEAEKSDDSDSECASCKAEKSQSLKAKSKVDKCAKNKSQPSVAGGWKKAEARQTNSQPSHQNISTRPYRKLPTPAQHDYNRRPVLSRPYRSNPKMDSRVIRPSRADVVLREDVIESPNDPRPNAFFDSKTGILRVYHGQFYGNPFDTILPHDKGYNSLGTSPTFLDRKPHSTMMSHRPQVRCASTCQACLSTHHPPTAAVPTQQHEGYSASEFNGHNLGNISGTDKNGRGQHQTHDAWDGNAFEPTSTAWPNETQNFDKPMNSNLWDQNEQEINSGVQQAWDNNTTNNDEQPHTRSNSGWGAPNNTDPEADWRNAPTNPLPVWGQETSNNSNSQVADSAAWQSQHDQNTNDDNWGKPAGQASWVDNTVAQSNENTDSCNNNIWNTRNSGNTGNRHFTSVPDHSNDSKTRMSSGW